MSEDSSTSIRTDSADILETIYLDLERQADERTKNSTQYYFKERIVVHGVKTVTINKMARQYFKVVEHLDKDSIYNLAERLMKTDYLEEASIAFDWVYRMRGNYEPGDFALFESWVERFVNNWAKCDTFCNHAVGAFIEQFPEYLAGLKQWAKSANPWLRRASAVSLIMPARKGFFLKDVLDISDSLLAEREDLVQKGCGWMLREAGKLHQDEVFGYILSNKASLPRTTLRYAIERMPPEKRRQAMEK
jgi:3-methyladenine DNA glycosylase AlkD